jgi:putative intracellular protease/amidase
MKILLVLTSHDQLGDTGLKTGFWLEEFATPYYAFKDKGLDIVLASPKGGQPPIDPKSEEEAFLTESTKRFNADEEAKKKLSLTLKLDSIKSSSFDAVFYSGGHGPLWDLAEDRDSIALIESFSKEDKPMGFVCHALGALRHVKASNGTSIVSGKTVTGFSNSEEAAVELTNVVPFLLEQMLVSAGANYKKGNDWESFTAVDGKLVTGQNPGSSQAAAEEIIKLL